MSEVKVYGRHSDEWRRAQFVATGTQGELSWSVMLDLADATPEERERLIAAAGYVPQGIEMLSFKARLVQDYAGSEWIVRKTEEQIITDEPPTRLADVLPIVEAQGKVQLEIANLKVEAKRLNDELAAKRAASHAQDQAARAEREAAEAAARESREVEKRAWIEQHGSAYLRKAVGSGYDCQRRYVLERCAVEHPGAAIDIENTAGWRSRSCPSEKALDLAEKVEGEVVWLTSPPSATKADAEDTEYFEPKEAVVVRGWLDKYDIVYGNF